MYVYIFIHTLQTNWLSFKQIVVRLHACGEIFFQMSTLQTFVLFQVALIYHTCLTWDPLSATSTATSTVRTVRSCPDVSSIPLNVLYIFSSFYKLPWSVYTAFLYTFQLGCSSNLFYSLGQVRKVATFWCSLTLKRKASQFPIIEEFFPSRKIYVRGFCWCSKVPN